jgi:hypothetical protein
MLASFYIQYFLSIDCSFSEFLKRFQKQYANFEDRLSLVAYHNLFSKYSYALVSNFVLLYVSLKKLCVP